MIGVLKPAETQHEKHSTSEKSSTLDKPNRKSLSPHSRVKKQFIAIENSETPMPSCTKVGLKSLTAKVSKRSCTRSRIRSKSPKTHVSKYSLHSLYQSANRNKRCSSSSSDASTPHSPRKQASADYLELMPSPFCIKIPIAKTIRTPNSELGPTEQHAENRKPHSQNNSHGFVDIMKQTLRNATKAFESSSLRLFLRVPYIKHQKSFAIQEALKEPTKTSKALSLFNFNSNDSTPKN